MSHELATIDKPSLIQRLSGAAGLDPAKYYAAVKMACGCDGATDENFAVLLMSADKYGLNPMLRQLFLMRTKKGVEVVIPIDGWVPLLTNHRDYIAHGITYTWEGDPFKTKCLAATLIIWTKSRNAMNIGPFEHSELMEECWRDTGPWKSHPVRMLGHKAVIQGTRRCFGIYVMDADEASGIAVGDMPAAPQERRRRLADELAEPEAVEEIIEADIDQTEQPAGCVEVYRRHIETCNSGAQAAFLAIELGKSLAAGHLSQDEADVLSAQLRAAME